MTDCFLECLRGLWSFILGSLRIILFFLCIIFLIIQTVIVIVLLSTYEVATTAYGSLFIIFILANAALFLLSLLGCYGTFYKHIPTIRMFALLTGTSAILLTVGVSIMCNSGSSQQLESQLKTFMEHYDWNHESSDPEVKKETMFWDVLQSAGQCCGYDGQADWISYSHVPGVSPGSCCRKDFAARCVLLVDPIYSQGCKERLESVLIVFIAIFASYIGLKFLLCIIACMVGNLNLSPRVPLNQQQPVTTHYVYTTPMNIRQPATNPYHPTSDRESKAPLVSSDYNSQYNQPPAYPRLDG